MPNQSAKVIRIIARLNIGYYLDTFILFLLFFAPKLTWRNLDTMSIICLILIIRHHKYLRRIRYAWDFWVTYICSTYILLILWIWLNPDPWQMPKAIRIPINYVGVFVFSMHVLTKYRKHGTAPAAEGQIHLGNSVATPTPVTDGERIYVYFGLAGLLCTNLHGKVV